MKEIAEQKNKNNEIFKKKLNYYIKDPIHKEINFSNDKWLADFAFSFEMTRLLEIKQLGISFKIFPSATQNRYSHCLGTFCVAKKFAKHFINQISKNDRKLFLLAAMLHDIGHGPFSHVFEKISNINHEKMGMEIIKNPNLQIYHLLKQNKVNPDSLINVYTGECKQEWISRLISSNLDVDRIDYLLRDSYYIGTCFSTIDIDFLVERSVLLDNDVCFTKTAINYIESFLLGRFYMHDDIYANKNTYIYEWSLIKIFERLKEIKNVFYEKRNNVYFYDFYEWIVFEKKVNIEKTYIYLNDSNLSSFLWSLKSLNDKILNTFIDGFNNMGDIYAVNFNSYTLEEIKKKAKNISIDAKYLFDVIEKKKKQIYYEGEKNMINIYDSAKKEVFRFPSEKILSFKDNKKENNKIILINKSLIN
ncbi:MAG: HD domain-containing protein [Malacoplasma sp.]|nr:HD domain-containing protein [Malacoplasma sp.]